MGDSSRLVRSTQTWGILNPSIILSILIMLRPSMRDNNLQRQHKETNKERRRGPMTYQCKCPWQNSSNKSITSNSMGGSSTKCITQSARRVLAAREGGARSKGRWIRLKGSLWHPRLRLSWWPSHLELVNRETLRCPQLFTISCLTCRRTSQSIETKSLIINKS